VPENDTMMLNGNAFDAAKTNLFRAELGQAPISGQSNATSDPQMYCQNIVDIQTAFLVANEKLLAAGQSPVTAVGDNLLTFMADQLNTAFTSLACQDFGLTNPVTVTRNAAGVAVAAHFNASVQTATAGGKAP
jgi:hypothetical protein